MLFGNAVVYGVIVVAVVVVGATVGLFKQVRDHRWYHWAAVGLSVVLGGATFILLAAASHFVRVAPDLEISQGRLIGTATVHVGDHDVEISSHGSGVTVVLNETALPMHVESMVYGDLSPGAMVPPDIQIPAKSTYAVHSSIDHIGPYDPPPSSVQTKGGGKIEYWLTW